MKHQYQTILILNWLQINSAIFLFFSIIAIKSFIISALAKFALAIMAGNNSNLTIIPIYKHVREINCIDKFLDKVQETLKKKKKTIENIGLKYYFTRNKIIYNVSNLFVFQFMVIKLIYKVHKQFFSNYFGYDWLIKLF